MVIKEMLRVRANLVFATVKYLFDCDSVSA